MPSAISAQSRCVSAHRETSGKMRAARRDCKYFLAGGNVKEAVGLAEVATQRAAVIVPKIIWSKPRDNSVGAADLMHAVFRSHI